MGCNGDYLNQTNREKQLQQTAKFLVFVAKKLNNEPNKLWVKTANDYYAAVNLVPELCSLLNEMNNEQINAIVYNAKDKTSRALADWYEEHKAADEKRIAAENEKLKKEKLIKSAKAKLTPAERKAVGLK